MKVIGYIVLGVLCVWFGSWLVIEKRIEKNVEAFREVLASKGGSFDSFSYKISGFPFSYKLQFNDVEFHASSEFTGCVAKKVSYAMSRKFLTENQAKKALDQAGLVESPEAFVKLKSFSVSSSFFSPFKLRIHAEKASSSSNSTQTELEDVTIVMKANEFHSCAYKSFNMNNPEASIESLEMALIKNNGTAFRLGPCSVVIKTGEQIDGVLKCDSILWENGLEAVDSKLHIGKSQLDFLNKDSGDSKISVNEIASKDVSDLNQNLMTLSRTITIKGISLGKEQNEQIDSVEISGKTSCMKDQLDKWRNFDQTYDNIKATCMKSLKRGVQNVPELKNLVQDLEQAKIQLKFNLNILHQGKESFCKGSLGIDDLFPELEVSSLFVEDLAILFPRLKSLSSYGETTLCLKDRTLFSQGIPINSFEPIAWDELQILSEYVCEHFLGVSPEEYGMYIGPKEDPKSKLHNEELQLKNELE